MRKKERAQVVLQRLNERYPETPVPLDHRDPFTLLIAVLLSAQCTDKKVNEVTPALFAAGPDPEAMAELEEEEILKYIRQLGLAKTKARNVRRLAQLLLERHNGEVPQSFEALESLPGVGHKTASVVMSQAFGVPAFPVDTHIHRLAQRWGLSSGENVQRPNGISRLCFLETPGIDCTFRSFSMGGSSAPPVAATAGSAQCARSCTRTAANRSSPARPDQWRSSSALALMLQSLVG